MLNRVNYNE